MVEWESGQAELREIVRRLRVIEREAGLARRPSRVALFVFGAIAAVGCNGGSHKSYTGSKT